MIDTHAHIDSEQFAADRKEMIDRAFAAGVEAIIIPSISPEGFNNVQALVDSEPRIYRGIGIHPHNAYEATAANLARVERESSNTRVVAIGEIGLDYYYDFAPKDVQQSAFRSQLQIAKRQNLPVIIHNRESDDDVLSILKEEQDGTLQFVLHCFSSSVEVLHRALDIGAHISFTGNITYKKSTLTDVVQQAPLDKIMIETDSPYMAPVPYRGKRNEPSLVGLVAQKIAEIHTLSIEKVYAMTSQTARSFFRLGLVILMVGVLLAIISQSSIAQTRSGGRVSDDRADSDDTEEVEIDTENPYSRTFGVGLMMGTNTIVESIECLATGKRESRSYEGILLYGIAAEYCLTDHIQFEGSYVYSINHKVVEENPGLGYSPNLHQFISLAARFVANPRKPICFFATGGSSLIFNRIFDVGSTQNAFNFGIGLYGNIPSNFGIIVPTAELKFDFPVQSNQYNDVKCGGLPADVSRFYSLVRFGVQWYPKF